MTLKVLGWGLLAVVVLFFSGWLSGASGRSTAEQEVMRTELRANLIEARALISEARVNLFLVNFGEASKGFEAARSAVERAQAQLRETRQAERAGRLEIVLAHLRDAQRQALALDASAQGPADEAVKAIKALMGGS